MNSLLVIYYHEVVEIGEGYSYQKIDENKFEEQMKYLHDNEYNTLFFSELTKPLPDKAVIVSFDDGFKSVYTKAAPIMKKYGIKGNVYLPTKYIGTDEHFMSWNMVDSLSKNGFEMQAHTHSHLDIRTLNKVDLYQEIKLSDDLFEKHLGEKPCAFCMPYGAFDKLSINRLKQIGRYQYVLASYYGRMREDKLNTHTLPRIGISNDDSRELFEKKIQGKLNWKGWVQLGRLLIQNMRNQTVDHYDY